MSPVGVKVEFGTEALAAVKGICLALVEWYVVNGDACELVVVERASGVSPARRLLTVVAVPAVAVDVGFDSVAVVVTFVVDGGVAGADSGMTIKLERCQCAGSECQR